MSQTGKLTPNLDQQSTKILNLTVLQRVDPYIEDILIIATHVSLYGLNIESNQWSRKDVEGSLFVVQRSTQPRFQFIVMNRRNTDNLVENLLGDFEYELQVPYILYRNAAQEVNGIWFYNPSECEDVANLFTKILDSYTKLPQQTKASSSKDGFEELEAVQTMPLKGSLEPLSIAPTSTVAPEDPSFMNFFSTASSIGNIAPAVSNSRQSYHSSATVTSHAPRIVSSSPSLQVASISLPASSTPTLHHDTPDTNSVNQVTNLVKPSSFLAPTSAPSLLGMPHNPISRAPSPALHSSLSLQSPYARPLLQPGLLSNPHNSLYPISTSTPYLPNISRDKVREAFLSLVQDDLFIGLIYQAMLKVHHS
ncbi:mRNA-decapping enzyme-like protein [Quillaja saponaria]|uniref:mRNA-decapping enzyme-like protein n=1 Tax=Quillaja saponaria TaxID=32244 RepID=A0AAD7VD85_QUISA|nr:mRNA-decapping enzyme-like protein [Quillaja saponaria]